MAKKTGTLNYNSSKKDFGVPSAKISLIEATKNASRWDTSKVNAK